MKVRLFKPGDRVCLRTGGPVMTVQRYTRKYNPMTGWYESNDTVECTWYGPGGMQKKTVHQQSLIEAGDRKQNLFRTEGSERGSVHK